MQDTFFSPPMQASGLPNEVIRASETALGSCLFVEIHARLFRLLATGGRLLDPGAGPAGALPLAWALLALALASRWAIAFITASPFSRPSSPRGGMIGGSLLTVGGGLCEEGLCCGWPRLAAPVVSCRYQVLVAAQPCPGCTYQIAAALCSVAALVQRAVVAT